MPNAQQRMEILLRLERGEISPSEAELLLSGMADLPPATDTRMGILEQVERGQLSAEEATRRLLQQSAAAKAPRRVEVVQERAQFDDEYVSFAPVKSKSGIGRFLLIVGLVITIGSALWMGNILQRSGMNFWFFCLWLPFAIGLVTLVAGWAARSGEWMRLRVGSHKPGEHKVNLDLPLPVSIIEAAMKHGSSWFQSNRDKTPRSEGS